MTTEIPAKGDVARPSGARPGIRSLSPGVLLALAVVLEFVAGYLFYGLPILVAAASLLTSLRSKIVAQITIWTLALLLVFVQLTPLFATTFAQVGPERIAS